MEGHTTVAIEGDTVHLGAEYLGNDPHYANWLFRVLSQLIRHTHASALDCLICDSFGDWRSERVYSAA